MRAIRVICKPDPFFPQERPKMSQPDDESVSKRHGAEGSESGEMPDALVAKCESDVAEDDPGTALAKRKHPSGAAKRKARAERDERIRDATDAIGRGGPPPNVVRDALRSSHFARYPFLNEVIDGEVVERVEVELATVWPFLACTRCGYTTMRPMEGVDAGAQTIVVTRSASVKDRLAALEQLARYGLGQVKEASTEQVRERVLETIAIIRRVAPADVAAAIIADMRAVWVR